MEKVIIVIAAFVGGIIFGMLIGVLKRKMGITTSNSGGGVSEIDNDKPNNNENQTT